MLDQLKKNLIQLDDNDDDLLCEILASAVSYAESNQNLPDGYYVTHTMPPTTRQAVIMLATHWYESRDGSTGGFFSDSTTAADSVIKAVKDLLTCNKEWKI